MSEAFTSGPWAAFTDDSGSRPHTNIVSVVPRTACVFSLPGRHKNEPDVQLVIAAPDLLAALEALLGDYPEGHLPSHSVAMLCANAINKARAKAIEVQS